jgi:hypothetical protein
MITAAAITRSLPARPTCGGIGEGAAPGPKEKSRRRSPLGLGRHAKPVFNLLSNS